MENESLNRFGEAFYKAEPMDSRERRIAIEKWAERPHKGCNRTKCYFHASPNNCNYQGYCNYLPYMIDHPEDRPENGSCMRGCLPGAGCIRYVENNGKRPKQRQTRMVITLPKNQEQKERYLKGKRKNDEGVPMHRFDTEKAMQLYQDGKCDWEIAEKVGRTRDTIATWRRSLKLPSNWMPEMEKKDYTFQFDTGKASSFALMVSQFLYKRTPTAITAAIAITTRPIGDVNNLLTYRAGKYTLFHSHSIISLGSALIEASEPLRVLLSGRGHFCPLPIY